MDEQRRSEQYLFAQHSREELAGWARRLLHFRFCRAWGGQANDADQLLVALKIDSERDLVDAYSSLGILHERVPLGIPQPLPGVAYSLEAFSKFPKVIRKYPTMKQPGIVSIAGQSAYAWVDSGSPERLTLSLSNQASGEAVTEETVQSAERIESELRLLSEKVIDPPLDDRRCICPKWHPEFWSISS